MSVRSSILDTPTGQCAPAAESRGSAFARLLRLARGNHVFAAMDQSIVSATSFLTLIMIARWTDAGQLGLFVIANSVLGVLSAVQHALVATPYAVQRHRGDGCARERAFSCLVQSGLFAAASLAPMRAAISANESPFRSFITTTLLCVSGSRAIASRSAAASSGPYLGSSAATRHTCSIWCSETCCRASPLARSASRRCATV